MFHRPEVWSRLYRYAALAVVFLGLGLPAARALDDQTSIEPTSYDRSLATIYRRSADSEQVYRQVIGAIAMLPPRAKSILVNFGVRWVEVPSLIEYDPALGNQRSIGWENFGGGSYEYVAATYSIKRKQVLVAERARRRDGVVDRRGHRLQTTLHETGHALDWSLGRYSKSDEFRDAYLQDRQKINDVQQDQFRYFLQSGDSGPSEVFAQLFAEATNKLSGVPYSNRALVDNFPRCFLLVLRQVQ